MAAVDEGTDQPHGYQETRLSVSVLQSSCELLIAGRQTIHHNSQRKASWRRGGFSCVSYSTKSGLRICQRSEIRLGIPSQLHSGETHGVLRRLHSNSRASPDESSEHLDREQTITTSRTATTASNYTEWWVKCEVLQISLCWSM